MRARTVVESHRTDISCEEELAMFRTATVIAATALLAACGGADPAADDRMAAEEVTTADAAVVAPESPDEELRAWIRANYAEDAGEDGTLLYRSGQVDLDGDGTDEILAYVGGPMLCGTGGCSLVVLQHGEQGLDPIGDIGPSQLPVGVYDSETFGWKDLAVSIYGGGIEGGVARVPFGENAYADNPTVAPAAPSEEAYETVIEDGPLEAVN